MIRGGWSVDRDELYAMAGIQPKDLDLVQFYDDYPVIVMMQYEGHGLCAEGEGAEFVRAHTLDCEGTMPTNTSGGQLSMGQAGAAGGYLGLVETVRQLTDRPLGKAVPDANIGLVSGFGMITYDRCLCTGALILGRDVSEHASRVQRRPRGAGPRSPATVAAGDFCTRSRPRPHRPDRATGAAYREREPAPANAAAPRPAHRTRVDSAPRAALQCGGRTRGRSPVRGTLARDRQAGVVRS